MSVKIYHGYRLPAMPAAELLDFCLRAGVVVQHRISKIYRKDLAALAANIIDSWRCGLFVEGDGRNASFSSLYMASAEIIHNFRKALGSMERGHKYDYSFSFSLIPRRGRSTLALLYTERRELRNAWEQFPEVRPWPYWDNADRPDGVSRRQWDRRRKGWLEALGRLGDIPKTNSLVYDPVDELLISPVPAREITKYLPPIHKRVDRMARDLYWADKARGYDGPDNEVFHWAFGVMDHLGTPEGLAELREYKRAAETGIAPELTEDMLTSRLKDL